MKDVKIILNYITKNTNLMLLKIKKLSRYFVERLLKKFELTEAQINRCLKVSTKVLAQVLELLHSIVKGKNKINKLELLKKMLCDELKVIHKKLMNAKILKDVKFYLKRHILVV